MAQMGRSMVLDTTSLSIVCFRVNRGRGEIADENQDERHRGVLARRFWGAWEDDASEVPEAVGCFGREALGRGRGMLRFRGLRFCVADRKLPPICHRP